MKLYIFFLKNFAIDLSYIVWHFLSIETINISMRDYFIMSNFHVTLTGILVRILKYLSTLAIVDMAELGIF